MCASLSLSPSLYASLFSFVFWLAFAFSLLCCPGCLSWSEFWACCWSSCLVLVAAYSGHKLGNRALSIKLVLWIPSVKACWLMVFTKELVRFLFWKEKEFTTQFSSRFINTKVLQTGSARYIPPGFNRQTCRRFWRKPSGDRMSTPIRMSSRTGISRYVWRKKSKFYVRFLHVFGVYGGVIFCGW